MGRITGAAVAPATKQKARKEYDEQRRKNKTTTTRKTLRQSSMSLLHIFTKKNNARKISIDTSTTDDDDDNDNETRDYCTTAGKAFSAETTARDDESSARFHCSLCKKTFLTADEFEKHCAYSVIHSLNQVQAQEIESREMEGRLKELSSFDMLFEATVNVPTHQMTLQKESRKFLWRLRQHAVIMIGQNHLQQCCLHVFDPTQKTLLIKDTALFLFADAWALAATNTKLGQMPLYGPLLPDAVFAYMLDFVEIGLNRIDQSLVLLTPGIPHLNVKHKYLASVSSTSSSTTTSLSAAFSSISSELSKERSSLRQACTHAQAILAQTDRVLSKIRLDRESKYHVSNDGGGGGDFHHASCRIMSGRILERTKSFFSRKKS